MRPRLVPSAKFIGTSTPTLAIERIVKAGESGMAFQPQMNGGSLHAVVSVMQEPTSCLGS
jgi:hypothetical protein